MAEQQPAQEAEMQQQEEAMMMQQPMPEDQMQMDA